MATNLPTNVTFNKMSYFNNVATEIYQTFDSLIEQLIVRREDLLQRVHELREDYRNKEATRIAAIKELERVQQQMRGMSIKVNPNLEFHQQATQVYQQGMKKLEPSDTVICPNFTCQNKDTIRQLISQLGEIVQCEIPDYSLKGVPVLTVGKFGRGTDQFNAAGIAFDESTEQMYIAIWNNWVQIVSLNGELVTQFGNDKLMIPWGIAVTKESIFVTDVGHHALFQFWNKDFKLINRTGTKGNKEGELYYPRGLCIDTNGDVLVADSFNQRVSVFSKLLKFKSCIGIGQLSSPQDVKLSAESIVVLDWSLECVHFFSREGHLLSSCVSTGKTEDSSVNSPYFFCLDSVDNIIISDYDNHAIKVYTESGHHIHTLGKKGKLRGDLNMPYGVCIAKFGTICVVSENPNYPLQCF